MGSLKRLVIVVVVLAAAFGLILMLGHRYGLTAVMLVFPPLLLAVGIFMSRQLVHGIPELLSDMKHHAMRDIDGRHYEFDGHAIRIISMDGTLWAHEADLRLALAIPDRTLIELSSEPHRRIEDHAEVYGFAWRPGDKAISVQGIERLVERRTERSAGRFLAWFERDVLAPWQRKRGIEPRYSARFDLPPPQPPE